MVDGSDAADVESFGSKESGVSDSARNEMTKASSERSYVDKNPDINLRVQVGCIELINSNIVNLNISIRMTISAKKYCNWRWTWRDEGEMKEI